MRHRDPLILDGERYIRSGYALELLTTGTHFSPLTTYSRLKKAAEQGDVRVYRLHSRLFMYAEADVMTLRAALIEG
jgi:hypothetical protein